MMNLANTFAAIPNNSPVDVTVDFGDFSTTTVVFNLVSSNAQAAYGGAVSFSTTKSAAMDVADRMAAKGLKVA